MYTCDHSLKCAPTSNRGRALPFTGQPAKTYELPTAVHGSYSRWTQSRLDGVGVKTPLSKMQWAMSTDVLDKYNVDAQVQEVEGGVNCLSAGTEPLDHLPLHLTLNPRHDSETQLHFHCANIGALYQGASICMEFGVDNPDIVILAKEMAMAIDYIVSGAAGGNRIADLAVHIVLTMNGDVTFPFALDKTGNICSLPKGLPPATFDELADQADEVAALVQIGNTYDRDGFKDAAKLMAKKMDLINIEYDSMPQALYVHALRNATAIVHWQRMHHIMTSSAAIHSTTKYDRPAGVATMLIEAELEAASVLDVHFHAASASNRLQTEFKNNNQLMLFGSATQTCAPYPADVLNAAFNEENKTLSENELAACNAFRVCAGLVTTSSGRFIVFTGHFKYPKTATWASDCADVIATWHRALQRLDTTASVIMGMDTNLQSLQDTSEVQANLMSRDIALFNAAMLADPPHSPVKYILLVLLSLWVFFAIGFWFF